MFFDSSLHNFHKEWQIYTKCNMTWCVRHGYPGMIVHLIIPHTYVKRNLSFIGKIAILRCHFISPPRRATPCRAGDHVTRNNKYVYLFILTKVATRTRNLGLTIVKVCPYLGTFLTYFKHS